MKGNTVILYSDLFPDLLPVFKKLGFLHPYVVIADVSVTKHHQQLNETRIIFTFNSSKSCFQKSSIMQYTPSTLHAIQFAQHTLATLVRNVYVSDRKTTLLIPV